MPANMDDPERAALAQIRQTLEMLEPAAQRRVLAWFLDRYPPAPAAERRSTADLVNDLWKEGRS